MASDVFRVIFQLITKLTKTEYLLTQLKILFFCIVADLLPTIEGVDWIC